MYEGKFVNFFCWEYREEEEEEDDDDDDDDDVEEDDDELLWSISFLLKSDKVVDEKFDLSDNVEVEVKLLSEFCSIEVELVNDAGEKTCAFNAALELSLFIDALAYWFKLEQNELKLDDDDIAEEEEEDEI